MMQVHLNGRGIAGVYPWEVAETKADTVAVAGRATPEYPAARRRSKKREALNLCFPPPSKSSCTSRTARPSSRRHAYLTLEHLLYALAHDPDGERILARLRRRSAAAAARPRRLPRRVDRAGPRAATSASPSRRRRSAACCRRRCCTCRARSAQEAQAGDICAAHPAAAEDPRRAAARRAGRHAARHPRVHLARHHRRCRSPTRAGRAPAHGAAGRRRRRGPGHRARSAGRLLRQPDRARARRACSIR